jgi:hypothetical protein
MTTVGGVLTSTSVTTAIEESQEAIAEDHLLPVIPGQSKCSVPCECSMLLGMGIDEMMKRDMNRDVAAIPPLMSLPGLGPMNAPNEQGRRQGQGRQQPKRSHRQFERMWMGQSIDFVKL